MITLQDIQTRQAELAAMIEKFAAQPVPAEVVVRTITVNGAEIELQPGEHYAGAVLEADGSHRCHLVLMAAVPAGPLTWDAAMEWAGRVDGELPSRQEQALLFANCKPHLEAAWHWSREQHASDASSAWGCNFGGGYQSYGHKSFEGCARAVRRI